MSGAVDLRSDTVTKPSPAMRRAMADAEVGDDVFAEDPTVRKLEETVAALLGKEAALYVPTGSMGNQISIRVQAAPATEVILEARSHILNNEMGGQWRLSPALSPPGQPHPTEFVELRSPMLPFRRTRRSGPGPG